MGVETKIQWTGRTFNPWIGCTEVSPGCAHCYAKQSTRARVLRSQGQETWGKGAVRSRTTAQYWRQPLRWDAEAKASGEQMLVFCASLADWLDPEVPKVWRYDLLDLIQRTPHLTWQLLTKRPQLWKELLKDSMNQASDRADDWIDEWLQGRPPANVWVGATAEDQMRFNERYGQLSTIPAKVRFWSMEPLLGSIDFSAVHYIESFKHSFQWVIIGGESGPGARECDICDISDIVSQCELAEVPCFVKQLGSKPNANRWHAKRKVTLNDPKGGDIGEWPENLKVRQFPRTEGRRKRA